MYEAVGDGSYPAPGAGVEPGRVDDAGGDKMVVEVERHTLTHPRAARHHQEESVDKLDVLRRGRVSILTLCKAV